MLRLISVFGIKAENFALDISRTVITGYKYKFMRMNEVID